MIKINANLAKIITILNDGEVHSGQVIGEQLQISRTAIWKYIETLVSYGINIVSIKRHGYQMPESIELLDKAIIKKQLIKHQFNHRALTLDLFDSVDSTNQYLKKFYHNQPVHICLAEQQAKGYGRFKRAWHSPFAKNIYLSYAIPFHQDLSKLAGLPLVLALATINGLSRYGITDQLKIKWPNDIYYQDKKLAGILVEISAESNGLCRIIFGIGINVNDNDKNQFTSLAKITGENHNRNTIIAQLIITYEQYLEKFKLHGLEGFMSEWHQYDYLHGKTVTLHHFKKQYTGTVLGICSSGALIIQSKNKDIHYFTSGDTTVGKNG